MSADQYALPTAVSDVDVAFPFRALEIMPSYEACERGLAELPDLGRAWRNFQSYWFAYGLSGDVEFDLAAGVDGDAAIRHLRVIQGSYAPKHEHKEAAVAYLASRWFTDVRNYKHEKDRPTAKRRKQAS